MKKVFLIVAFNKKSRKYAFKTMRVFASKEFAEEYKEYLESIYLSSTIKVDLIECIEYMYV